MIPYENKHGTNIFLLPWIFSLQFDLLFTLCFAVDHVCLRCVHKKKNDINSGSNAELNIYQKFTNGLERNTEWRFY